MGLSLLSGRAPRLVILVLVAATAGVAPVARAQVGTLVATVRSAGGAPVADAVIVAVPADGSALSGRPRAEQVDQIDKEFVPQVKAVFVGSTVAFPNKDNVRHHVYSFSPAKRFALPLYSGVPAQPVVFDKPGVVVLGCNIHDWMVGYIYVSESPWFGKTDAEGRATLADLPARRYVVRVWHSQQEGLEEASRQNVDVTAGQRGEVAFTVALKPDVRVRRSPTGGHGAHY